MLKMNKMGTGIITMLLLTQSILAQEADEMFSLIRKINVDHLGTVGQIDGCEFSKDNYYIIASDNHATAKVYIRETGAFVNQVKHIEMNNVLFEKPGKMNAVGYSYDRQYFYTGINDQGLKLWDADNYTLVHHFVPTSEVDGADFSLNDQWLATGSNGDVHVYNMSDYSLATSYSHSNGNVNHLDFNLDSTLLLTCASKGQVIIMKTHNHPDATGPNDWSQLRSHQLDPQGTTRSVKRVSFSRDGSMYVVGARGIICRIYRTSDGAVLKDLIHDGNLVPLPGGDTNHPEPAIEGIHWSANGKYLFTGGVIDGIIRCWRVDDWSLVGTVRAQGVNRQIEYLYASSDNEVITGGAEGVLYHFAFTPPPLLERFEQAANSIVCLDVVNNDASVPLGGHEWVAVSDGDAVGGECLQALPNDGTTKNSNFATYDPLVDAPKLDYRINFNQTGNYYVWIRAKGGGSDNSVHVGIDGVGVSSSDKIEFPASPSDYVWSKATKDGTDARLSISSVGAHTVNVWMCEDGTKLDRILLTLDGGYDPSSVNGGEGPKGSNRYTPEATGL